MTKPRILAGWGPSEYELVDFGHGRKLERFLGAFYDRPSPAAANQSRQRPNVWQKADARYDREQGKWITRDDASQPRQWVVHGSIQLEVRRSTAGQLGVFPEQSLNWAWLSNVLAQSTHSLKLLNLFAYTGGSTLTAAASGAHVVHVDASRTAVQWARGNSRASALQDCPIRWIQEDATKFVEREIKRGNRYHGVILDPPSYGHGPKGEVWSIDKGLPELLERCGEVTNHHPSLLLLTCHSPGYGSERLAELIRQSIDTSRGSQSNGDLWLSTIDGRQLHCGHFARYAGPQVADTAPQG